MANNETKLVVNKVDDPNSTVEWSIMGWVDGKAVIDIVLYSSENLSVAVALAKKEWELAQ